MTQACNSITFEEQRAYFAELVAAVVSSKEAQEMPIEDIEQAILEIEETLDLVRAAEADGDGATCHLQNFADIAAICVRVAHSVIIPDVTDAQLHAVLCEWQPVQEKEVA